MMRLSRLRVLRELAEGRQPQLMWQVEEWLYKHGLIDLNLVTTQVVLTAKGRADMEKANNEYARRPRHGAPPGVLVVATMPDGSDVEYVRGETTTIMPHGVKSEITYPSVTNIEIKPTQVAVLPEHALVVSNPPVSPETRKAFVDALDRMGHERVVTVLPDDTKVEYVPIEEEPRAPTDELSKKRQEKEQLEKAAQLAEEIAKQQDRMRKYTTEVRVLDAYREVAVEVHNFGQNIEDVYVGKLNDVPIQFNPFIPHNALVFYPDRNKPEKLMVGYNVAKNLITKQPPEAVAFDGMADLKERCGAPCWRCAGTGNLSRNYTVNDKLCPECRGSGWSGGSLGGGAA